MNDDLRYLHKWCNEEQTAPIDRVALAKMLALVTEMGEALEFRNNSNEPDAVDAAFAAIAKYKEMTNGD